LGRPITTNKDEYRFVQSVRDKGNIIDAAYRHHRHSDPQRTCRVRSRGPVPPGKDNSRPRFAARGRPQTQAVVRDRRC